MNRAPHRSAAAWGVFVALSVAAIVVGGISARGPVTAMEAAAYLAAESLLSDADLTFSTEDETRMRARSWPEEVRPPMVVGEKGVVRYEGPYLFPLLLAPFAAAFGRFGALVVNALLLVVAVLAARGPLNRRYGGGAPWTLLACVFASALFAYLPSGLPVFLLVAATSVALALLSPKSAPKGDGPPQLYEDPRELRRPIGRFLAAGLLFGVVAAHDPLYLLLLATVFALTRRRLWARAMICVVAGAVALLSLSWLSGGLWPENRLLEGESRRVEVSVGEGLTVIERSTMADSTEPSLWLPVEEPTLMLWNGIYALVGRYVGLFPYFLPLLFLLGSWRPETGRGMLLAVAAAGLVVSIFAHPFDFAGLPESFGNRLFIPFFVALWWLPARSLGRTGALVSLALASAVLWPLWTPADGSLARVEGGAFPAGPLLELLPPETTQRDIPVRGEVVTRDLLVRPRAGIEPAGRRGHFVLPKGRIGELTVASPESLSALQLVFDSAAASSLDVTGGSVASMMLAPDGGVAFEILVDESWVRHPVWWSGHVHSFSRLRISMPEAKGATAFSIGRGE